MIKNEKYRISDINHSFLKIGKKSIWLNEEKLCESTDEHSTQIIWNNIIGINNIPTNTYLKNIGVNDLISKLEFKHEDKVVMSLNF